MIAFNRNIGLKSICEPIDTRIFHSLQIAATSLTNFTVNSLNPSWIEKYKLNQEVKKFVEGETDRFSKYTNAMIDKYSNIKTIVFGSQNRKLEELYIPLTISRIMNNTFYEFKAHDDYLVDKVNTEEIFQIKNYDDKFIPNFKKVLLIDSVGMGKSTLMKWLYLSCIIQSSDICDHFYISKNIMEAKCGERTIQ